MLGDSTEELRGISESRSKRLSYKFQRLRERLRSAITTGELAGKLPGERVLARKFKVNAKTLSKALTDLAAEGLLERNIGLGTFVRGANDTHKACHRCLVLQDSDEAASPLVPLLGCENVQVMTHSDPSNIPPSLLSPHRSVVVWSQAIGDDLLRDLVVRGKQIVLVDRLLTPYVTHSVVIDRAGAAASVMRRLSRYGHRQVLLIDAAKDIDFTSGAHEGALVENVDVRSGGLDDIAAAVASGATAILCSTAESARHAMDVCKSSGLSVPGDVSIAAIGRRHETVPCSGDFVTLEDTASAIRHLLQDGTAHRPVALWLHGDYVDAGTIGRAKA